MKKSNAWYEAIIEHLSAARGPLGVGEIWRRMQAAGFTHKSAMPRSTLGARIAELVQLGRLERVGPSTYRISTESSEVAS